MVNCVFDSKMNEKKTKCVDFVNFENHNESLRKLI